MATIRFNQLSFGALARICLVCNVIFLLPLGALAALASLFGAAGVKLNGAPVTGMPGFLVGLAMTAVAILFYAVPALCGAALARLFGPSLELRLTEPPVKDAPPRPIPRRVEDDPMGL